MALVQTLDSLHLLVAGKFDDMDPVRKSGLRETVNHLIDKQTTEGIRGFWETGLVEDVVYSVTVSRKGSVRRKELCPFGTEWDPDRELDRILFALMCRRLGHLEVNP